MHAPLSIVYHLATFMTICTRVRTSPHPVVRFTLSTLVFSSLLPPLLGRRNPLVQLRSLHLLAGRFLLLLARRRRLQLPLHLLSPTGCLGGQALFLSLLCSLAPFSSLL